MKHFKIEIYEQETKQVTIRIPLGVLTFASKLIPQKQLAALEEKSIDLDGLIEAASHPDVSGLLMEIENHKDNEKILISVE